MQRKLKSWRGPKKRRESKRLPRKKSGARLPRKKRHAKMQRKLKSWRGPEGLRKRQKHRSRVLSTRFSSMLLKL
jgi:hypothetical protein